MEQTITHRLNEIRAEVDSALFIELSKLKNFNEVCDCNNPDFTTIELHDNELDLICLNCGGTIER
jgi:hypothetical protein